MVKAALMRGVSSSIDRCELTFLDREPIDHGLAVVQHHAYGEALREAGFDVVVVPADADCPDCCFVEDTAVVLDEAALITRMGAPSRRGETPAMEEAVSRFREIVRVEPPATIDGGDVLRIGRTLFAGLSRRTNAAGVEALRAAAAPYGYAVVPVPVEGVLHLKSAVTALDDATVLAHPEVLDVTPLSARGLRVLRVPEEEPAAANVLRVAGYVWVHSGFRRTADRLADLGFSVKTLDISEFLKAEAGLTCLSLLFGAPSSEPVASRSRP
jgi:dimethylargininase